jgi:nitrite reductase/ring-hydroxylating ferredoxin subunit
MSGPVDSDSYHYVVSEDALKEGDRAIIETEGRSIAVFKVDDEYLAVSDHCPHMGGPCAEGELHGTFTVDADGDMKYDSDDYVVSCPWHGWMFDVRTGEHRGGSKKRLVTYDVVVEGGDVFVVL